MSGNVENSGSFESDNLFVSSQFYTEGGNVIVNSHAEVYPSFFQSPDTNYELTKRAVPRRAPNTCRWVFEHPMFLKWSSIEHSEVLWLTADPGCGKSVLSKALIDEQLVGKSENTTICYFFFKDDEYRNRSASALCAILHQIFCIHPSFLKKYALRSIHNFGDALKKDTFELWRILMRVTQDATIGEIVCVLDALDDCQLSDRNELIADISNFYNDRLLESQKGRKFKLFLTSRPYPQIEQEFSEYVLNLPMIRLAGEDESEKITKEIDVVIATEVDNLRRKWHLNSEKADHLRNRLSETKHRTYLWLYLMLGEIREALGHGRGKLEKLINTLPRKAEDVYEAILQRCSDKKAAKRLLQVVVAAYRPLTIDEIDIALEIEPHFTSFQELDREGLHGRKAWIQSSCGLFVSIVDNHVMLIHETAREFLVQRDADTWDNKSWRRSIDLDDAHAMLAKNCITLLTFNEFRVSDRTVWETSRGRTEAFQMLVKAYPFFEYCSFFWHNHVAETTLIERPWYQKVRDLCEFRFESPKAWFGCLFGMSLPVSISETEESRQWVDWSSLSSMDLLRLPSLYWVLLTGMRSAAEIIRADSSMADKSSSLQQSRMLLPNMENGETIAFFLYSVRSDIWPRFSISPAMEMLVRTWNPGQIMVIYLDRDGSQVTVSQGVAISLTEDSWPSIYDKQRRRLPLLVHMKGVNLRIQESSCGAPFVPHEQVKVVILLLRKPSGDVDIIEGSVEVAMGDQSIAVVKLFEPAGSSRADLNLSNIFLRFANIFSRNPLHRRADPQRLIQNTEFLNLWACLQAIGYSAQKLNIKPPVLKLFDGFYYWKVSPTEELTARAILEDLQLPKFHWLDGNQAYFFVVRWIRVCMLVFDPTLPLSDDALGSGLQSSI